MNRSASTGERNTTVTALRAVALFLGAAFLLGFAMFYDSSAPVWLTLMRLFPGVAFLGEGLLPRKHRVANLISLALFALATPFFLYEINRSLGHRHVSDRYVDVAQFSVLLLLMLYMARLRLRAARRIGPAL